MRQAVEEGAANRRLLVRPGWSPCRPRTRRGRLGVAPPALARRLGVPFLQRATTSSGGTLSPEAGPGPCAEQLSADEAELAPAHRLLASFTQAMPVGPTQSPPSLSTRRTSCAGTARKASAVWPPTARG